MLTFGLIAEGPTDQTVIENILTGYFADRATELDVRPIQPPRPLTDVNAGWGHVFKSVERKEHENALQFVDYLVIHIDTDKQEDSGFDVPRRENGVDLSVRDRVDRVITRLQRDSDIGFFHFNAHRILFAIAVDTIKCWLLPLLYENNKAAKTTGCLEAANQELRRKNQDALSAGESKYVRAYEAASKPFQKRRVLIEHHRRNPSLELFIQQLKALEERLNTGNSPAS